MPELINIDADPLKETEEKKPEEEKNEQEEQKPKKKKALLTLGTTKTSTTSGRTGTTLPKVSKNVTNSELYEAVTELVEEVRKLIRIQYALLSLLQREVYSVTEELDDPILSKLPPKAKKVFVYIMEVSKDKKYIPSLNIMAKFNLTQEELFQIVNEINKVIQQYGFSIRFVEMESEEEY